MTTLEERIGYSFVDKDLLDQSLTHKSYFNEQEKKSRGHNERLEFLGDAVLDLALSDLLMKELPDLDEGPLSKMRAALVNETVLADIAKELSFQNLIHLGRGEMRTGGANKPRLLASALEAFVGAFYLDAGFSIVQPFLNQIFIKRIRSMDPQNYYAADFKTRLQEKLQEKYRLAPAYEVTGEEGPDHDKIFFVVVKKDDQVLASGQGRSKKQAEQDAARKALEEIG